MLSFTRYHVYGLSGVRMQGSARLHPSRRYVDFERRFPRPDVQLQQQQKRLQMQINELRALSGQLINRLSAALNKPEKPEIWFGTGPAA